MLTLIIAAVIVWGFLGALPFRAQGLGVTLMKGSTVYAMTAPISGRVASVDVTVGQQVKAGDRLVLLHLPDIETRQRTAQRRLDALLAQRERQSSFVDGDIENRRRNSASEIAALNAKIGALRERQGYLRELLKTEEEELAKGYITRQELESTRNELSEVEQDIRETQVEIARQSNELQEFINQRRESLTDLDEQIIEARGNLQEIRATEETDKAVESPIEGVVTAIATKVGVLAEPGVELVTVEERGTGLEVYAYLPLAKGKKVLPGMRAQVSPTAVERDIYGSIIGKVTAVSDLPVSEATLRDRFADPQLVEEMLAGGAPLQITIELEEDASTFSGFAWSSSSGPPSKITPGSTAAVAIVVRQQRPVELIVPIFETWVAGRRE